MHIGEQERSRSELDARAKAARVELEGAGRELVGDRPRSGFAAWLLALVRLDARRGESDGPP